MGIVKAIVRIHFLIVSVSMATFNFEEDFIIERETVKSVTKVGSADERGMFTSWELEKACETAYKKLSLQYVDEDDTPDLYRYMFEYEHGPLVVETAARCATLPSTYIRVGQSKKEVIFTTIESTIASFKISREKSKPTSITLANRQPSSSLAENRLSRLNHSNRQNLCVEARKVGVFLFTNDYVPKVHAYEFVYPEGRRVYHAIACPTYPVTYLRLETSESDMESTYAYIKDDNDVLFTYVRPVNRLEIVRRMRRPQTSVDAIDEAEAEKENEGEASFRIYIDEEQEHPHSAREMNKKLLSSLNESDRQRQCVEARKAINYAITLSKTIGEARFVEFDYGNGLIKKHFVLICSAEDQMFVYLDHTANEATLRQIILTETKLQEYE